MKNLFKKVILSAVEGPTFVIILFAFCFLLFAAPVKAQNLDSLNNIWLNKNLPDTVRFQAYAEYIFNNYLNSKTPDPKTALLLANQMKEEAKQSKSLFGLGISCAMIAESHWLSGKYDEAENASIQSISFYEKIKNKRKLGLMYLRLGYIYKAIDKDSLAIVAFENSNVYKQNVSNYLGIGNIYFAQNKYYKALKEFKIAMELSIENKNVADFDKSFYNIKKIYDANLQYDQLLGLNQKAIDFYEINGSKGYLGNIYCDLGILYIRQNLFDEALSYNKKSIAIYQTEKNYREIGTPLYNIGDMYLKFGETDSALFYFKKALEYDLQNQSFWALGYSYGAIGETYLLKNDFDEAQKNFEKSLDCRIKKGVENDIAKTELLLSKLNLKKIILL
jgi:tetratricopeptide (TPR) repeat protein